MSIKVRSLGTVAGAVRGIVATAFSIATPSVGTFTAGHRLKDGDRIGISGCTVDVSINGDWSVDTVAATTMNITGSKVTLTVAGTIICAALCDRSPFLPRHSALFMYADQGGVANANFVGTVVIEAADRLDPASAGTFYYDSSTGVDTGGFKSALKTGEIAIPAQATAGGGWLGLEVNLSRYMAFKASSHTSGNAYACLAA